MSALDEFVTPEGDNSVALPSNPADRQKLKTMISEATYALQRVDDEKAAIKDIIDAIHDDYQLSKKHVRRLINTLYKQNYDDRAAEEEQFEFLYEALFQTGSQAKESQDQARDALTALMADDGDE